MAHIYIEAEVFSYELQEKRDIRLSLIGYDQVWQKSERQDVWIALLSLNSLIFSSGGEGISY